MSDQIGGKNAAEQSEPRNDHPEKKCDGSITITNDNRHIYPNEAKCETNKPNWVEKGTLFVLTLTLGAAAYAGFEAHRLAELTKIAVADSETTATQQAADTAHSLKISKTAADAATAAADAAVIGNRAWISPRLVSIQSVDTNANSINILVLYDNAGRTPALDVSFHSKGRNLTSIIPMAPSVYRNIKFGENESCGMEENSFSGVIYPASNQVGNVSYFTLGGDDATLIEKMKNIREVIAIQGCYKYRTLNSWHKSTFCSYLEPNTSLPIEKWQFKNCGDGADELSPATSSKNG